MGGDKNLGGGLADALDSPKSLFQSNYCHFSQRAVGGGGGCAIYCGWKNFGGGVPIFFFGGGMCTPPENASMLKVPYIEITCELIIVFEKIA
jgi:hypothetical protein